MTSFATVLAFLRAGATTVLSDIVPDTALLDVESAATLHDTTDPGCSPRISLRTRGMDDTRSFCSSHRIMLIEDCTQAHLASLGDHGRRIWGCGRLQFLSDQEPWHRGGRWDDGHREGEPRPPGKIPIRDLELLGRPTGRTRRNIGSRLSSLGDHQRSSQRPSGTPASAQPADPD